MINNDLFFVFSWWSLIFILGLFFLPLTFLLFKNFFDKGYIFSKLIAILSVSYISWLLSSLKILPFNQVTILVITILLFIANLILRKKKKINLKSFFKENWKIFLFEELLFLLCLLGWSFVRGFQPNIHGLEKFMDYGFINSILRSPTMPPKDMWFAGQSINYYYFGHFITALLTKLSGINSTITYNLMVSSIFAFSFLGTFSLGANISYFFLKEKRVKNLKLIFFIGFLAAFFLNFGGNLHPLYWLLKNGNFQTYWYPDATRFIVEKFGAMDNTIHEFPIYSFIVADLHGHLLNLPFVLLFIGMLLRLFLFKNIRTIESILFGFLLGIMYITSSWDLPIYFLLLGFVILYKYYLQFKLSLKTFLKTFFFIFSSLVLAILFSLPFHLNFTPISNTIGLVDFNSPLWMLLILWGFPLFITLSFLNVLKNKSYKRISKVDSFVVILIILGWLLIIIPEVIYVKDIYIHSYQRANTMFKLTYQSFVIFSLSASFIFLKIFLLKDQKIKILLLVLSLPFLFSIFIYPFFAMRSSYGFKNYKGLYGLNNLKTYYKDDYQAILWLRQNIEGQPVILEAVGESYTDFARVSANTGLPTILGWRVHEWLWRGSFDEPGQRTEEVKEIYEGKEIDKAKEIIEKYKVELIFLGDLEREQYINLNQEKIESLGEILFNSGETKIYKIN